MSLKVEFRQSGKTVDWAGQADTLLELAEQNGVVIDSECEQGYCGACKTKLLAGKVDMEVTDGLDDADLQEKMILPCVATPKSDLVIDA